MWTTDITPNSFDDMARLFHQLGLGLTDKTDLMRQLGEALLQSTKDRFPEGKAPDGTAWAPKSQATLDSYRSREGKTRNASVPFRPLFGPSGRLSSEINYEATAQSVEIGSALIYAGVMQGGAAKGAFGAMANGSPIPWGDIPARPFLGISAEDEETIGLIAQEWLDGLAAGD